MGVAGAVLPDVRATQPVVEHILRTQLLQQMLSLLHIILVYWPQMNHIPSFCYLHSYTSQTRILIWTLQMQGVPKTHHQPTAKLL